MSGRSIRMSSNAGSALFALGLSIFLLPGTAQADCTPSDDLVGPHTRASWVEGGLVYDLTNDILQTCDGTNWTTVSGTGGIWATDGTHVWRTTGNVGIGTVSPTRKLHISSTDAEGGLLVTGSEVDGPNIRWKNSANNTWSLDAVSATNSRMRILTEGGASGNQVRLTIEENGNVGIGTTSPETRFHAQMSGTGSQDVALLNGGTGGTAGSGARLYLSGGNGVSRGTFVEGVNTSGINNVHAMVFGTSSSASAPVERVRITGDGNVGIGTTAPDRPLHIAHTTPIIRLHDTNGAGDSATAYLDFYDSGGNRTGFVGDGDSGNAHIYTVSNNGNVYAIGIGGGCYVNTGGCSSDRRLKQDIQPIKGALDRLINLNGISFEWKKNPGTHYFGFLAQEVEQQFPTLVETGEDGYKTVNYNGITAPVVEAIKELKAANDNLRAEFEAYKAAHP